MCARLDGFRSVELCRKHEGIDPIFLFWKVVSAAMTSLNLSGNRLCGVWEEGSRFQKEQKSTYNVSGITALAEALRVNAVLKKCAVRNNRMDEEAKAVLQDALKGREGFELIL